MTRQGFLEELRRALAHLPKAEVDEIVRDQDEYIRDAVQAGRSEEDVLRSLGSPASLAASLLAETRIQQAAESTTLKEKAGNTFGAVAAIIALAPLNLIFVLGPFLGAAGLLIGGWAGAAGILLAALGFLLAFFVKLIFLSVGFWAHVSTFFFAVGCVGLSLLAFIFMAAITKAFLTLTLNYLKWNLNFIRARA